MGKRKVYEPEPEVGPQVSAQEGKRLLQVMLQRGDALLQNRPLKESEFDVWSNTTLDYIRKAFGSHSNQLSTFVGRMELVVVGHGYGGPSEREQEQKNANKLKERLEVLSSLIGILDIEVHAGQPPRPQSATASSAADQSAVFVVHGRNHGVRETVARFLEKLNLTPVILDEQPNEGLTIIEKFEKHSSVGFSIVIMTADDQGSLAGEPADKLRPRARQNAIFELGYFVAKLSRKKVCALIEPGIERPTDYDGVLFVPFDGPGAWRFLLAREMKAAGLDVDMNLAT